MNSQFKPSTVVSVWTGFSTQLRFKDPVSACRYYSDHKTEKPLVLLSQTENGFFLRSSESQGVRFFSDFNGVSRHLTSIFSED